MADLCDLDTEALFAELGLGADEDLDDDALLAQIMAEEKRAEEELLRGLAGVDLDQQ